MTDSVSITPHLFELISKNNLLGENKEVTIICSRHDDV